MTGPSRSAQFAGQHIQLRFRDEGVDGWGISGTEGWYLDDVTLNNVLAADAPTLSDVSPDPTFDFTPTEPAQFDLKVRPQFFGVWLRCLEPGQACRRRCRLSVAPAITAQPQNVTVADGGAAVVHGGRDPDTPPLTFPWSHDGIDLVDGPGVTGSGTASQPDRRARSAGRHLHGARSPTRRGIVSTSDSAVLTVNPPAPPPPNTLTAASGRARLAMVDQRRCRLDRADRKSPTTVWTRRESGAITDSQSSQLEEPTVTGPATLSFWWKVDSEPNFDFLKVDVDGVEPFPGISGNVDWQQKTIALPAGAHTIHWTYTKDASVSVGQDAALARPGDGGPGAGAR